MLPSSTIRGVVMAFHSDLERDRLIIQLMTSDGTQVAEASGETATAIVQQLRAARARKTPATARCTGAYAPGGVLMLATFTLDGA